MPRIKKHSLKLLIVLFSLAIFCLTAFLVYKIADKKRIIDGRKTFTSVEITLSGESHSNNKCRYNHTSQFIIMFFDPIVTIAMLKPKLCLIILMIWPELRFIC
jgi:hypothetical protein